MARKSVQQVWDDTDDGRVRVLLECEPSDSPTLIASLIERHGFDVRVCEGPGEQRCTLLNHEACGLVDGADVVVNLLHHGHDADAVLDAVAAQRRPPAVVTDHPATPERDRRVVSIASPVTRRSLLGGISDALQ